MSQIIKDASQLFESPPDIIIFVYKVWQPIYDTIHQMQGNNVHFMKDIPSESQLMSLLEDTTSSLIVFDDYLREICDSKVASDFYSRFAHHCNCSSILITQLLGLEGKFKHTVLKNIHTFVLFGSPLDNYAVRSLGIKLGQCRKLMDIYNHCTSRPRGYVIVDLNPLTNRKFRYRSHILGSDDHCHIYT